MPVYEDPSGHIIRRNRQKRTTDNPIHTWCSRCGGYVPLTELPESEQRRLRKH